MLYQVITKLSVAIGLSVMLATCGGGGSTPATSSGSAPATPTYSVGGIVSGLRAGLSVVLQDSSGASASLSANGSYTLLASTTVGTAYSLSVETQPLGQVCTLSNASGSVTSASVGNVALSCANALNLLAGNIYSPGHIDGSGSTARFNGPQGIATDRAGNVFVADTNNQTIRKITPVGVVSTLAGTVGVTGADNGAGSAALFYGPRGIATDVAGNVFVAERNGQTIRKITPAGEVSDLWGSSGVVSGLEFFDITNRPGVIHPRTRHFYGPDGLATDSAGNVFVASTYNHTILKFTPAGVVSTFAGSADRRGTAEGTGSEVSFYLPNCIATDGDGKVFVADSGGTIRKITQAGVVTILAGTPFVFGTTDGLGGAASFGTETLRAPKSLATDSAGNVFVADAVSHTVRKITPAGLVSTVVGSAGLAEISLSALPGGLINPYGVAVFGDKLFISSSNAVLWTYLP